METDHYLGKCLFVDFFQVNPFLLGFDFYTIHTSGKPTCQGKIYDYLRQNGFSLAKKPRECLNTKLSMYLGGPKKFLPIEFPIS